jgi:hypothetical protein
VAANRPERAADLVWALQILAAAQFFLTALDKLSDAPVMVQLFDAVGFGQWFRYFTGIVEFTGAVLLLVPSMAAVGSCSGRGGRSAFSVRPEQLLRPHARTTACAAAGSRGTSCSRACTRARCCRTWVVQPRLPHWEC